MSFKGGACSLQNKTGPVDLESLTKCSVVNNQKQDTVTVSHIRVNKKHVISHNHARKRGIL